MVTKIKKDSPIVCESVWVLTAQCIRKKTTESERLLEWWQDLWSDNEARVGRIRRAAMVLVYIGQQCKAFKSVTALNAKIKSRKKSEV